MKNETEMRVAKLEAQKTWRIAFAVIRIMTTITTAVASFLPGPWTPVVAGIAAVVQAGVEVADSVMHPPIRLDDLRYDPQAGERSLQVSQLFSSLMRKTFMDDI